MRPSALLELSLGSPCAAYDREFVAPATDPGVSMVTSDRQMLAALPKLAASPQQMLK